MQHYISHVLTLPVEEEEEEGCYVQPQPSPHPVIIGFDLQTDVISNKSPCVADHRQAGTGSPRSVLEVDQFVQQTRSPRSALAGSRHLNVAMQPAEQQKAGQEGNTYNSRAYCGFTRSRTELVAGYGGWPFSTINHDEDIPRDIDIDNDDGDDDDDDDDDGKTFSILSENFLADDDEYNGDSSSKSVENAVGVIYNCRYAGGDYDIYGHCVNYKKSIFCTSSPNYSSENSVSYNQLPPAIDFLSKCFLCNKHLAQGKDIYMYRGDCAFCSQECRYRQIVMDER